MVPKRCLMKAFDSIQDFEAGQCELPAFALWWRMKLQLKAGSNVGSKVYIADVLM